MTTNAAGQTGGGQVVSWFCFFTDYWPVVRVAGFWDSKLILSVCVRIGCDPGRFVWAGVDRELRHHLC